MCGIFGYYNYQVPQDLKSILSILFTGLKRLEYRGYDSAGICIDGVDANPSAGRRNSFSGIQEDQPQAVEDESASEPRIIKCIGKIENLEKLTEAYLKNNDLDEDKTYKHHVAISHTRWATHGQPSPTNSHPHVSDVAGDFVVVHNGIITNYKALKDILVSSTVR
jgi:glucosamine--fructose-6-phosphate aminotransferase (isomerizing)